MFRAFFPSAALLLSALLLFAPAAMAADAEKTPQLFNDWGRLCEVPAGGEKEICYIFQRVNMQESNKTILHIRVGFPQAKEQPVMVLTLPLGVALAQGVQINVDEEGAPSRAGFSVCLTNGCLSSFAIEPALVGALKAGKRLNVAFANTKGQVLRLPVSLKGFTAAYKSIQQ